MRSRDCRRRRRPRAHPLQPDEKACADESHRDREEGFLKIREDIGRQVERVSLAGWLRIIQRKPIALAGS